MWKKLGLMVLILALVSMITIPPAEAGSRDLLKALAISGLVAAFLAPPPVIVSPAPRAYYPPPREEYVPGHWEMRREWVPGTRENVWVSGYHDRWGRRVPGHYEQRQSPGYYEQRRVWVEEYYRPY